jgi:hypothetical protein
MKNKELIIGIGVAVVVYLLWKRNKKQLVAKNDTVQTPSNNLTEQEKFILFNKAINTYRGGARPPQDLLDRIQKEKDEANAKIKELKLETEFSTWLSNRPKESDIPMP